jgi:hypothetical protein
MATLPTGTRLLEQGFKLKIDPSVLRTDMERGLAKERVQNTKTVATVTATLMHEDRAAAIAFDTWYETEIKRIGWFDVRHPLTRTIVQMRFVGGDIGELEPLPGGFQNGSVRQNLQMEYKK